MFFRVVTILLASGGAGLNDCGESGAVTDFVAE